MRTARRGSWPMAELCGALALAAALCDPSWAGPPPRSSGGRGPGIPETVPPGVFPSGWEPEAVRERLSSATRAEVSRACGNISRPWAYRGAVGRRMTLRDFGRRSADEAWTRAVAGLLLSDSTLDSAFKVPSVQSPCEAATGLPIYLVRFDGPGRPTFAVLRFDLGVALLFDAELPLGMLELGDRADSLWASVASLHDDDPLLRKARPVPTLADTGRELVGDDVFVETLPEVLEHVGPQYPEPARREGTEGTVYTQVRVGTNGLVLDAIVLAGPPALRDASLASVWQWKFKAALVGNTPVAVWVTVPLKFSLH